MTLPAQSLEHLQERIGIGQLAWPIFFREAEDACLVHNKDGSLGAVPLGVVDAVALGDSPMDVTQEGVRQAVMPGPGLV